MFTKITLVVLVFCIVICVKSDESYGRNYGTPEYVRIKRAKYYSNPPMRFYKRPPMPHVVKGIYSYTPPPHLSENDSPHPGNFRPTKVNKRPPPPHNDGLGDEDIHNLVKNLSKQDLDKIITFTGEKYKEPPFEKYSSSFNTVVRAEDAENIYKPASRDLETNKRLSTIEPYVSSNTDIRQNVDHISSSYIAEPVSTKVENSETFNFISPHAHSYSEPQTQENEPVQIFFSNKLRNTNGNLQDMSGVPLETQESINNNQFSFVDSYIQQELNNVATRPGVGNDINHEKPIQEELPKPTNLRDDYDFEVSNTDNVPRVVKASSYKVENFGDLPLMNYNSKLHTVSSYHVPHYSVISQESHKPSSSSQLKPSPSSFGIKAPLVEPAPHSSAAKEQSDAHLKAIKIWTHQSKGTAYTLHDDGTLSLEKDGRPKRTHRL